MSNFKWADTYTHAEPPRRRRRVPIQGSHKALDWDAIRPRIEELWQDHELTEVRSILETEGFVASERQIRNHLATWGNKKYLKLSEKQWRYILENLEERSREGKHTAFRYKDNQMKLPSDRIQRTLTRKIENGFVSASSTRASYCTIKSTSSGGLMSYTPRASRGSMGLIMDKSTSIIESDSGSRASRCSTKRYSPAFLLSEPEQPPPSPYEASFKIYSSILRNSYSDSNVDYNLLHEGNSCNICEGSSTNLLAPPVTAAKSNTRIHIVCNDCSIHNYKVVEPHVNIHEFFLAFERDHLMSQNHVGRVHLRILGDPEPSERRQKLVNFGITCRHDYADDWIIENPACWGPGGCRWAQFKAVQENMSEFQGASVPDLSVLSIPPSSVPELLLMGPDNSMTQGWLESAYMPNDQESNVPWEMAEDSSHSNLTTDVPPSLDMDWTTLGPGIFEFNDAIPDFLSGTMFSATSGEQIPELVIPDYQHSILSPVVETPSTGSSGYDCPGRDENL